MVVIAKAPVPGFAKTRLAAVIGDQAAADIAAAMLLDTLDAVDATPAQHRVVALTGDLDRASCSAEIRSRLAALLVVEQRGDDFSSRLANAMVDAAAIAGRRPVLLIASDTPQVTAGLLTESAQSLLASDVVFGLARDGGWWILGVTDPAMADCLHAIPTSRSDTGPATLEALRGNGLSVALMRELSDVDTVDDIGLVRPDCAADSRFARATEETRI
ncbi:glycosyltransferase involved in cell wall biogenesis [Mycobacteriaceae bacterium 1482268.1]|nr:glycosyltransferase involved in cell wall biogenesis [Mycobacteriaceae bacterium 1482268.1]